MMLHSWQGLCIVLGILFFLGMVAFLIWRSHYYHNESKSHDHLVSHLQRQMATMNEKHEKEMQKMHKSHEKEMQMMYEQHQNHEKQMQVIHENHEKQMQVMHENNEKQMQEMHENSEKQMQEMHKNSEKQMQEMHKNHEKQMQEMHENSEKQMQVMHEKQIQGIYEKDLVIHRQMDLINAFKQIMHEVKQSTDHYVAGIGEYNRLKNIDNSWFISLSREEQANMHQLEEFLGIDEAVKLDVHMATTIVKQNFEQMERLYSSQLEELEDALDKMDIDKMKQLQQTINKRNLNAR